MNMYDFYVLRRRSHLVPGHCAQAPVPNCALFRLRCPDLNACSHSVPSSLSGHLNLSRISRCIEGTCIS